jgi:antitoxin CptB
MEAGALRWRCRRGTKELDVLLERYLQSGYPQASSAEQQLFAELLSLPDPLLSDYLFGHVVSPQAALAALVARIRGT